MGKGVYLTYEGYWKANKLEGKVIETSYSEGKPSKIYEGDYQDGLRSG